MKVIAYIFAVLMALLVVLSCSPLALVMAGDDDTTDATTAAADATTAAA